MGRQVGGRLSGDEGRRCVGRLLDGFFDELGIEAAVGQDRGAARLRPLARLLVPRPGQVEGGVLHIGRGRLQLGRRPPDLSGAGLGPGAQVGAPIPQQQRLEGGCGGRCAALGFGGDEGRVAAWLLSASRRDWHQERWLGRTGGPGCQIDTRLSFYVLRSSCGQGPLERCRNACPAHEPPSRTPAQHRRRRVAQQRQAAIVGAPGGNHSADHGPGAARASDHRRLEGRPRAATGCSEGRSASAQERGSLSAPLGLGRAHQRLGHRPAADQRGGHPRLGSRGRWGSRSAPAQAQGRAQAAHRSADETDAAQQAGQRLLGHHQAQQQVHQPHRRHGRQAAASRTASGHREEADDHPGQRQQHHALEKDGDIVADDARRKALQGQVEGKDGRHRKEDEHHARRQPQRDLQHPVGQDEKAQDEAQELRPQRRLGIVQHRPGVAQRVVGVAGGLAVQHGRVVYAVVVQVAHALAAAVGDLVGEDRQVGLEDLGRAGAGEAQQDLDHVARAAGDGAAGHGSCHLLREVHPPGLQFGVDAGRVQQVGLDGQAPDGRPLEGDQLQVGPEGAGQEGQAKEAQADRQAAADQVVDGASDDGVEGFGDDRAKEGGKVGAKEADQAADLEDAPQEHAADAGRVLQGLDQGGLQAVEGLLEPAGDGLSGAGGRGVGHRRWESDKEEHDQQGTCCEGGWVLFGWD